MLIWLHQFGIFDNQRIDKMHKTKNAFYKWYYTSHVYDFRGLHKTNIQIRIDCNVVGRIMDALQNSEGIVMTNLATKANIQYSRLVKYIEWLKGFGAVRIAPNGRFKEIQITEKGKELLSIFKNKNLRTQISFALTFFASSKISMNNLLNF